MPLQQFWKSATKLNGARDDEDDDDDIVEDYIPQGKNFAIVIESPNKKTKQDVLSSYLKYPGVDRTAATRPTKQQTAAPIPQLNDDEVAFLDGAPKLSFDVITLIKTKKPPKQSTLLTFQNKVAPSSSSRTTITKRSRRQTSLAEFTDTARGINSSGKASSHIHSNGKRRKVNSSMGVESSDDEAKSRHNNRFIPMKTDEVLNDEDDPFSWEARRKAKEQELLDWEKLHEGHVPMLATVSAGKGPADVAKGIIRKPVQKLDKQKQKVSSPRLREVIQLSDSGEPTTGNITATPQAGISKHKTSNF